MTEDQAATAWESMLTDANGAAPADSQPRTLRQHAYVSLRTAGLLIVATLAILVLFPAVLAAQAALVR